MLEERLIELFVYACFLYLLFGALFAIWFVSRGVDQLDEGMRQSNWRVRILIFPGTAALFPLLWRRLRQKRRGLTFKD
jgi:hypothetical protein